MICKCEVDWSDEFNFCPNCGGRNPSAKNKCGDVIFCDKCGKPVHPTANYCWFCREPNRFRIAKLVYLLAEKANVED